MHDILLVGEWIDRIRWLELHEIRERIGDPGNNRGANRAESHDNAEDPHDQVIDAFTGHGQV